MINITGYQIINQIYESANSLVYRGVREQDCEPVILKVLKQNNPALEEIIRYKQEYEITKNLNIKGVINVKGLENYRQGIQGIRKL